MSTVRGLLYSQMSKVDGLFDSSQKTTIDSAVCAGALS